jgi:hypothetical protein
LRAERQRHRLTPSEEMKFPVELEDAGDPTSLAAEMDRLREPRPESLEETPRDHSDG